jgi:type I restriction enzyme, S subunit
MSSIATASVIVRGHATGRERNLNPLPRSWCWTTIGDIASVFRGASPRPKGDPRYFGGPVPWIMISDLGRQPGKYLFTTNEGVTEAGAALSRRLPPGTLILSNSGTVCVPKILKIEGCIHDGFVCFDALDRCVSLDFAFWWFEFVRPHIVQENRQGVTQVNLNTDIVRDIHIPIPPRQEQHRIVEEIEKQLTRLDAAVAALNRIQANLKRYRAAVLKAACEGRLIPTEAELARREGRSYEPASVLLKRILTERRSRLQAAQRPDSSNARNSLGTARRKARDEESLGPDVTRLAPLPEGWVWTSLGQLFSVHVGATPSRAKPELWGGDVPWVSSGEVGFCRIRETREKITSLGLAQTSTSMHPIGTVLLGMIGEGKTRGQVAILEIEACNNQNSAAIRVPDTPIPPEYIYRFLEGEYDRTRRRSSGGNQPALNKERVKAIPFPLPPLAEIQRIVVEVERCCSLIDQLENQVEFDLEKAKRLRQAVLKRAFECRLVLQNASDEPANVLLERIRADRDATTKSAPTALRGRRKNEATRVS